MTTRPFLSRTDPCLCFVFRIADLHKNIQITLDEATGLDRFRLLSLKIWLKHDTNLHFFCIFTHTQDTLTSTKPVDSGMGMHLLQKMGWRPGEGLGKDKSGSLQPLLLEVKNDRRGLVAGNEVTL